MPKLLKPNARLTLVLACDQDEPADTMPKFFGRSLSVDASTEMLKCVEALDKAGPGEKPSKALDCVMFFLTGWENMTDPDTGKAIEFSRENLGKILTFSELQEVIEFAMSSFMPSAEDKKKSE